MQLDLHGAAIPPTAQAEIFGEEALVGAVKGLDTVTMREFDGHNPSSRQQQIINWLKNLVQTSLRIWECQ